MQHTQIDGQIQSVQILGNYINSRETIKQKLQHNKWYLSLYHQQHYLLLQNPNSHKQPQQFVLDSYEGMLKWNSQEITNAKTIHASRKFRNRWPCQKFRASAWFTGAAVAGGVVSVDSFHCSVISTSFAPTTLQAVDPQISQVLHIVHIHIELVPKCRQIIDLHLFVSKNKIKVKN